MTTAPSPALIERIDEEDCLLHFGEGILPMFRSNLKLPLNSGRDSMFPDGYSRIVGVESDRTLSEIRKRTQQKAVEDEMASSTFTTSTIDEPLFTHHAEAPCVWDENSTARVIVASSDLDNSQTYVESVSLAQRRKRLLVATLPGRRDVVHASVSGVGANGEVLVAFTERVWLKAKPRPPNSSPQQSPATGAEASMLRNNSSWTEVTLPPAVAGTPVAEPEYEYRLYICATRMPSQEGNSPSTDIRGNIAGLPLCLLDITPPSTGPPPGQTQLPSSPPGPMRKSLAYPVAYFVKTEEKKGVHCLLLAADNTEVGLSLRQAQFSPKGNTAVIKLTSHEKWSLAKNQFWHQWDPHAQQVVFAAHCVQFVKFRMIALDGHPDRRLPLFERNVKPTSLHLHHGTIHPAPFCSGASTPNTSTHFTVLPVQYECGAVDYALCTQVIRKGKHLRHTCFSSKVVVTITLLRNQLRECRVFIDVPYNVRSRRSDGKGVASPPSLAREESCETPVDDGSPKVCGSPNAGGGGSKYEDKDDEWRVCFAAVRGLIVIIAPHGAIHFVDVAHKDRCPMYLLGSSDLIFRRPLRKALVGEPVDEAKLYEGLLILREALHQQSQQQYPVTLSVLPVPFPNIIFVPGTTAAVSLEINRGAIWQFVSNTLNRRKAQLNCHVLLHAAVHIATTHFPHGVQRAEGYSMNHLRHLLIAQNTEYSASAAGHSSSPSASLREKAHGGALPMSTSLSVASVLSPDILVELVLGECYGRVRAKALASGCQFYLMLPMTDDIGVLERQDELFTTLRLSHAAAKAAIGFCRSVRLARHMHGKTSVLETRDDEKGWVEVSSSKVNRTLPYGGGGEASPAATSLGFVDASTAGMYLPNFRFHQMVFHHHQHPPISTDIGSGRDPGKNQQDKGSTVDGGLLDRPYSYCTTCTPSSKDIQEECSLTAERWWTRHVLCTAPEGFLQRVFSRKEVIPIQRASLRSVRRDKAVPFDKFFESLLRNRGVPPLETQRMVSLYVEEMSTLLDDIVEVVSQPPEVVHPHRQIVFLFNLCEALEAIQFPSRGTLRHRFSKLTLQHVPRTVVLTGMKSKVLPMELDDVIVSFRSTFLFSVWVEKLVNLTMSPAEKRRRDLAAAKRMRALRSAGSGSVESESDDGDEPSEAPTKEPPQKDDSIEPLGFDYHKHGRELGAFHRGRGYLHCAKSRREQEKYCFTNMVACSSMLGAGATKNYVNTTVPSAATLSGTSTRFATSFDEFDKQTVMVELFPHSTMQFHRNQLPLDGLLPNIQCLRSYANWKNVVDDAVSSPRRAQREVVDLATTSNIVKPAPKDAVLNTKDMLYSGTSSMYNTPPMDLTTCKKRRVCDVYCHLLYPLALTNAPNGAVR